MKISKLGYTKKWVRFGIITEEEIGKQLEHFRQHHSVNEPENYRFSALTTWLENKTTLSNNDVENYMELVLEDSVPEMGGLAAKNMIENPLVSEAQFNIIKLQFSYFGDWTDKIIQKETLFRRLKNEKITASIFEECMFYKTEFEDSRLLIEIINTTKDLSILEMFETSTVGKRIKKLAAKKINKIKREQ